MLLLGTAWNCRIHIKKTAIVRLIISMTSSLKLHLRYLTWKYIILHGINGLVLASLASEMINITEPMINDDTEVTKLIHTQPVSFMACLSSLIIIF